MQKRNITFIDLFPLFTEKNTNILREKITTDGLHINAEGYEMREKELKKRTCNMTKRVFITGGANGIGKAIVQAFASEGFQVAFCDVDDLSGHWAETETGAVFIKADAGVKAELESCMLDLFKSGAILIYSSTM